MLKLVELAQGVRVELREPGKETIHLVTFYHQPRQDVKVPMKEALAFKHGWETQEELRKQGVVK